MATVDLKQLMGRLNDVTRRALEAAAGMTLSRTHYNVELEHWLLTLADRADGDVAAIFRHYGIDQESFVADINRALATLTTGNPRSPSLAPDVVELTKQAWLLASLEHGAVRIRSGHLLWALLDDEVLVQHAREASGQLLRINADLLKSELVSITANTAEALDVPSTAESELQWGDREAFQILVGRLSALESWLIRLETDQNQLVVDVRSTASAAAIAATGAMISDVVTRLTRVEMRDEESGHRSTSID